MSQLRIGDFGTVFEVTVLEDGLPVNLAGAEYLGLAFGRPRGKPFLREAKLQSNGEDGKLQYTLKQGDLRIAGTWRLQVILELPEGTWRSTIMTFQVARNLLGV